MPDISMCDGAACSLKSTCYRHTAEPNPFRQAYFMQPPFAEKTSEQGTVHTCEFRVPNEEMK